MPPSPDLSGGVPQPDRGAAGLPHAERPGVPSFAAALGGTILRVAEHASAERYANADLAGYFEELARLHRRLCPRQVLGVRMGLLAGEVLGLELPRGDKRLLVVVETDGCFADGVSVATGCWLGRRTLRLADYGRVAATVIDTRTQQAVRLRPHRQARGRAQRWAPHAADRWHAQLLGYQLMPAAALLEAEPVSLATSLDQILGQAGVRVRCVACGEEVLNGRETTDSARGPLCPGCTAAPYYQVQSVGPGPRSASASDRDRGGRPADSMRRISAAWA
jgi:formylmethanofuran dehydrogenase subunit E